ncbi:unnamed protein product [Schistosoma intercalatum]|nr:unnamed protein product [Schistosoma intercalatum]
MIVELQKRALPPDVYFSETHSDNSDKVLNIETANISKLELVRLPTSSVTLAIRGTISTMSNILRGLDISTLTHQSLKDMGNQLFNSCQYNEAVQCYTHAITQQPNISSYYSNRALCYIQMQDYSKVLSDCRGTISTMSNILRGLDISTLTHQSLKDMGNQLFNSCQYNEAVQCYTHAITQQPNISSYYSNRALCYIQMQDYSKVLSDCRQPLKPVSDICIMNISYKKTTETGNCGKMKVPDVNE